MARSPILLFKFIESGWNIMAWHYFPEQVVSSTATWCRLPKDTRAKAPKTISRDKLKLTNYTFARVDFSSMFDLTQVRSDAHFLLNTDVVVKRRVMKETLTGKCFTYPSQSNMHELWDKVTNTFTYISGLQSTPELSNALIHLLKKCTRHVVFVYRRFTWTCRAWNMNQTAIKL